MSINPNPSSDDLPIEHLDTLAPVWLSPTIMAVATRTKVGVYQLDGDNYILRGTVALDGAGHE